MSTKKHRDMFSQKGFALFVAIGVVSIVSLISIAFTNVVLKQTLIASSGRESQRAFYAADNGVECALYWETINPTTPGESPFTTEGTQQINCGSGAQTVGGATGSSTFLLEFSDGTCAEVTVVKSPIVNPTQTSISSRGRNSCDVNNNRRVERGVRIEYGT